MLMTNVPHRASGVSESRMSEKPRCHIGIVAKKGATYTDRGRIHGPQPQQMRSQPSAIDTPRTASVERLAARRECASRSDADMDFDIGCTALLTARRMMTAMSGRKLTTAIATKMPTATEKSVSETTARKVPPVALDIVR